MIIVSLNIKKLKNFFWGLNSFFKENRCGAVVILQTKSCLGERENLAERLRFYLSSLLTLSLRGGDKLY